MSANVLFAQFLPAVKVNRSAYKSFGARASRMIEGTAIGIVTDQVSHMIIAC
jgi:hypothetical protein